jgi:hypothetical protein
MKSFRNTAVKCCATYFILFAGVGSYLITRATIGLHCAAASDFLLRVAIILGNYARWNLFVGSVLYMTTPALLTVMTSSCVSAKAL